ncbi:hypothetical protein E2986_12843 [Frieseomelitta varia]|uniref:Uncharacterized protein n=1 Tax=Frieseomelitta varia TaxID=561572 RepID=A0A833VM08_9HYME|nr:hypothetical protein E2986_12843 [Frieseomelitta varia]
MQKYNINFNTVLKISVKPGDNIKDTSFSELLKALPELFEKKNLSSLFEKKTGDTTEKEEISIIFKLFKEIIFGRFQESNLSDTHYVSFLHKEDSKSLESINTKESKKKE